MYHNMCNNNNIKREYYDLDIKYYPKAQMSRSESFEMWSDHETLTSSVG